MGFEYRKATKQLITFEKDLKSNIINPAPQELFIKK